jgi:hypothetical protein
VTDPNDPRLNARGSIVQVKFQKHVPEMNVDEVKEILNPFFDFHSKSAVEAYLETVPPKVKEAIKNHEVLVGMNRDMVTYAKGRAPRKIREKEEGVAYEEWIYGQPPQPVEFVRFVGEEVVKVTIMKVDGEKLVRTEKEVDLGGPTLAQQQQQQQEAQPAASKPAPSPSKRPTLRRPGEIDVPPQTEPGTLPPKEPEKPNPWEGPLPSDSETNDSETPSP